MSKRKKRLVDVWVVNGEGEDIYKRAEVLHEGKYFVVTRAVVKGESGYKVTHARTGGTVTTPSVSSKRRAAEICDLWNRLFDKFGFDSDDQDAVRDFHKGIGLRRLDEALALEIISDVIEFDNGVRVFVRKYGPPSE